MRHEISPQLDIRRSARMETFWSQEDKRTRGPTWGTGIADPLPVGLPPSLPQTCPLMELLSQGAEAVRCTGSVSKFLLVVDVLVVETIVGRCIIFYFVLRASLACATIHDRGCSPQHSAGVRQC